MSALDMSNRIADSDHQSALTIIGQNKIQETVLESKEEMEGIRNDFEMGEGGLGTAKSAYNTFSEGAKAVQQGTAYGAAKLTEFTEGVAKGVSKTKAAGSALYTAGSTAVEGGKAVGRAVQEGVNYTRYLAGQYRPGGVGLPYQPLYPNAPAAPDAAPAAAADNAAADAGSATERLAQDTTDALKGIGSKMELAGKAVGVLGGIAAAGDDIIHGKIEGDNAWERTGNILTIAGTVADLIPGLEPIGLGLNLWAAADDFKGESDAETVQKQQNDATHTTLTTDPAPVHTWSQMGLVASVAPDAVHQNVGNVHF
eukprot:COSAG06_NODE_6185_length_3060_cov_8.926242_4_plen_312_part_00